MDTTENANLDFLQFHNRTPEQFHGYQHIITQALDWLKRNRGFSDFYDVEPASDIVIISWLLSDHDAWLRAFDDAWHRAAWDAETKGTFWKSICEHLATPDVQEAWAKIHPDLDTRKWFYHPTNAPAPTNPTPRPKPTTTKKISYPRGILWILHPKWKHLRPSSQKVFLELLRRSQHPTRPNSFPWCRAGMASLAKYTNIKRRQTTTAIAQLQRYGLIKRIFRGYKAHGLSVYLVFLTPKMSGAYSHKATRKRGSAPTKKPKLHPAL